MKVLHIISSGGMYGAEAVILNLSHTLNETKGRAPSHRSCLGIFTSNTQPNHELYAAAQREGVETYPIACHGQLDLLVSKTLYKLAERLQVDVVHAHGYKADVYSWVAMRSTAVPLVSTCHTWYDNNLAVRLYGSLDRWVLRQFNQVVAVSQEVRLRLLRAGVKSEKIRMIPNGVDLRSFAGTASMNETSNQLQVGLVGRLAPEKGCDVFIRAAARVLQELPHVQFHIAGDGPDRVLLEHLIAELGVERSVFLGGRCDDMPLFYRSLDLLVSASRQEGLPIALLEGMAASLPLVATRVGEVPSLVLDGVTGTLVPAEDIAALASAMSALLRDSSLRRALGAAACERVASTYSADRMSADYLALYEHVVTESKAKRPGGPW